MRLEELSKKYFYLTWKSFANIYVNIKGLRLSFFIFLKKN